MINLALPRPTSSSPGEVARRLREWLWGDAVASAGAGLVMAAGAWALTGLVGLPVWLLLAAGVFLLPWAAMLAMLARRPVPSATAVAWVIGLNLGWVVASAAIAGGGLFGITPAGMIFVAAQATVVFVIAVAQWLELRAYRRARLS